MRSDVVSAARTIADKDVDAVLRAVTEFSDDAIFTCDPDWRITSWSAPTARLFGLAPGDALGQPFAMLFPDHLQPEVHAVRVRVAAGEEIRHLETEMLRADGLEMPVSLSICPIGDAVTLSRTLVMIVRDVTERVLAQATLASVEGRLREGEALAHLGSWMWDRRTGVVQWSEEYYRIHGVEPLDFDGTLDSFLAAIHDEDRDRMRHIMEASAASGTSLEAEYRALHPDGRVRLVRVRAEPTFGSAGTAVGLSGVGQDITDRQTDHDPRSSA